MKLFGQIVRTVVNTALLPVAIVQDIVTLGGIVIGRDEAATPGAIQRLKDEAEEK